MAYYTIKDNIMYDNRTGAAFHALEEGKKKFYAVVTMCGHCGNGYFIPCLFNISAASEKDAVSTAMRAGRVKKNLKNKILACGEINEIEYNAIEHINHCDPYHYAEDDTTIIPDLYERRIAIESVKDWQDIDEEKNRKRKTSIPEIRTADMYEDKYVLQRYFAPRKYGDKLLYPKRVNFKDMMDEFLYYNTYELGIRRGKVHALSYYYQLYGENNDLGIKYENGCISYKNTKDEVVDIFVEPFMKEHLDIAKAKFYEETVNKENNIEEIKDIKIESAKEKYLKRLQKYLEMKNKTKKTESVDEK